ncbi:MAG: hypothetical protein ACE5EG_04330 [Thermoanaerobaculia bacterium]
MPTSATERVGSAPARIVARPGRAVGGGCVSLILAAALLGSAAPSGTPRWVEMFGYEQADLQPIEIGDYGYPYLRVAVDEITALLVFDTGNTIGLSLSPELFDRLSLDEPGTHERLNSAGEVVATGRHGRGRSVVVAGRELGPQRIHEFDHPRLAGLASPHFLLGGHFTLDYGSRLIAASDTFLPATIPGFQPLPLVRSPSHPTLLLVHGDIAGRRVLIELDTGKSRTVVNPRLAAELGLASGPDGFRIDRLGIGGLSFAIANAKGVDQTTIDGALPEPILAGVGSDVLARFVWTADYSTSTLWVPLGPPR